MHATTARLYEAAKAIKGISEPSALARALNISPQVLNNWERRGMSADGILDAEEAIGCESLWLRTGTGTLHLRAQEPQKAYRSTPDATTIAVTSIQSVLQLAGLEADHLGSREKLSATLSRPPAESYPAAQIREATVEMIRESRTMLAFLSPEQIADALLMKLKHWLETPEPEHLERDVIHKK